MRIPLEKLSTEALDGILTEFVSRDGTELGEVRTKKLQALQAMKRGELVLCFDPASGTCNLLTPEQAREAETGPDNAPLPDSEA